MIPVVKKGDKMAGLIKYLVTNNPTKTQIALGAGRKNDHTDPHIVAGDDALMAWYGSNILTEVDGFAIAKHLDRPYKLLADGKVTKHVWHCPLSLGPGDGELSDELWQQISEDFVRAIFNDGVKSDCRWVAIRHGKSANGNDHVHIVVNRVREDGTAASLHRDINQAQNTCRALEIKYGLEQLEGSKFDRSTIGYSPAQVRAEAKAKAQAKYEKETGLGWDELGSVVKQDLVEAQLVSGPPKRRLARIVRGAAVASSNEAEFVRRCRRAGLMVRPFYQEGGTTQVAGWSVGFRSQFGEQPYLHGGKNLGSDLSLPRLRELWNDSPAEREAALLEWNAARRGRAVVSPGRETVEYDPELLHQMSTYLQKATERLKSVDPHDLGTWAIVARQSAGVFASWSNQVEQTPGPLAAAADCLSVSAQTRKHVPSKASSFSLAGTAMLLACVSHEGKGVVAQLAMLRQLMLLVEAVFQQCVASGQAKQAAALAEVYKSHLVRFSSNMEAQVNQLVSVSDGAASVKTATIVPPAGTPEEVVRILEILGQPKPEPKPPIPAKIKPGSRPAESPLQQPGLGK